MWCLNWVLPDRWKSLDPVDPNEEIAKIDKLCQQIAIRDEKLRSLASKEWKDVLSAKGNDQKLVRYRIFKGREHMIKLCTRFLTDLIKQRGAMEEAVLGQELIQMANEASVVTKNSLARVSLNELDEAFVTIDQVSDSIYERRQAMDQPIGEDPMESDDQLLEELSRLTNTIPLSPPILLPKVPSTAPMTMKQFENSLVKKKTKKQAVAV